MQMSLGPTVFGVTVLIAAVLALPGCSQSEQGKIVFWRDTDRGHDIHVLSPEGGGHQQLTHGPADAARPWLTVFNSQPAWSPDGARIVFVSNRDAARDESLHTQLYVMASDGSDQKRLTHNAEDDYLPDWSPDGSTIVFARGIPEDSSIYVISADGSGERRLTAGATSDMCSRPTWSPDGKRIAFVRVNHLIGDIWAMDADGSNPTQLTHNPPLPPWPAAGASASQPAWRPDGGKIAFVRKTESEWPTSAICVMNSDGSGQTPLTDESTLLYKDPDWSPDGRKIVFSHDGDLYLMNADGSAKTRLTHGAPRGWDWGPRWWGPRAMDGPSSAGDEPQTSR